MAAAAAPRPISSKTVRHATEGVVAITGAAAFIISGSVARRVSGAVTVCFAGRQAYEITKGALSAHVSTRVAEGAGWVAGGVVVLGGLYVSESVEAFSVAKLGITAAVSLVAKGAGLLARCAVRRCRQQ